MAAILDKYPALKLNINLTPALIQQINGYLLGKNDPYLQVARDPATLSAQEKLFLINRYFDTNLDTVINPHPRYRQLMEKRGWDQLPPESPVSEKFTEQDLTDLQVLFHLAWTDPEIKAGEPILADLVNKGQGYSRQDLNKVLSCHQRIMANVLEVHRKMSGLGRLELITTPFYHPILPLLINTEVAGTSSPHLTLPSSFRHPEDARWHIKEALALHKDTFGEDTRGMWLPELAISIDTIPLLAQEGIKWTISSEGVLAKSLNVNFSRNYDGLLEQPELLYQPYLAQVGNEQVAVIFRDHFLSDLIGFCYSRMKPEDAVNNLIDHLLKIHRATSALPHNSLVTIALDGENAWSYFADDKRSFLNLLYNALSTRPELRTTTVSKYLQDNPPEKVLPNLWPGSWVNQELARWIGTPKKNRAWEYLQWTRRDLVKFEKLAPPMDRQLAWNSLYAAEGSDYTWWFDSMPDQNSAPFDLLYRTHLQNVYKSLGLQSPDWLEQPIVPNNQVPHQKIPERLDPVLDGHISQNEWLHATCFSNLRGPAAMVDPNNLIKKVCYGSNNHYFYLLIDPNNFSFHQRFGEDIKIVVCLGKDHATGISSRYGIDLGFDVFTELTVNLKDLTPGGTGDVITLSLEKFKPSAVNVEVYPVAAINQVVEIMIPLSLLEISTSEPLRLRILVVEKDTVLEVAPSEKEATLTFAKS